MWLLSIGYILGYLVNYYLIPRQTQGSGLINKGKSYVTGEYVSLLSLAIHRNNVNTAYVSSLQNHYYNYP